MLPDCHLISHVLLHSSLYILLSVAWDLEPETCYMSSSCAHFEHLPDLFGTWFSCLPLWFVCLFELPFWFWPSPILLFHKHIYLHTINPWTISVCLHCDSIDLIHTWWHFCDSIYIESLFSCSGKERKGPITTYYSLIGCVAFQTGGLLLSVSTRTANFNL